MSTRLELRDALRLRLEDTGISALWDDDALNEALAAAVRAYGAAFPRQVTTGVTVSAGDLRVAIGAAVEPGRIARIADAAGIWVAPWPAGDEHCGERGQAWRSWGSELVLAEPAAASGAGLWTIEHLTGRQPPASDGEAVDVLPGDEEIILGYASAAALSRRAVEDAKRGIRSDAAARAESARLATERLVARRLRRARGSRFA